MIHSRAVKVDHDDLIHDIAYDHYGKRMATCSSDQVVKIWDFQQNGEWKCTAQWRNHLGPVWRVAWAHPEFGQVVASCSFDRTVEIWEELIGRFKDVVDAKPEGDPIINEMTVNRSDLTAACTSSSSVWMKRARFVDPRASVTDIEFSPRHMGLQLACVDVKGVLRVYEARDVMNLSQWTLQFDSSIGKPGSCLSWSHSRLDPPLIAVGCSTPQATQASSSGLACTNDNNSATFSGLLCLYECSTNNSQWTRVEEVSEITEPVYDLAFAPHLGQSWQQLAVGTANELIILRIKAANQGLTGSTGAGHGGYKIFKMASFNDHKGRVWRVSWNVTGSLLASTGDDGCVRLWRANYLGHWQSVSAVQPGASPESGFLTNTANETQVQQHLGLAPPVHSQLIQGLPILMQQVPASSNPANSSTMCQNAAGQNFPIWTQSSALGNPSNNAGFSLLRTGPV